MNPNKIDDLESPHDVPIFNELTTDLWLILFLMFWYAKYSF